MGAVEGETAVHVHVDDRVYDPDLAAGGARFGLRRLLASLLPVVAWALLLLGEFLCPLGGTASAQVSPVTSPSPSERVARLVARGNVLRDAGDALSALAYFRDAVSAAPRRQEGYVALGALYLALEEPVRALEVFETGTRNVMMRGAADGEALWLGLAATLRKLGQDERALQALRSLRDAAPDARGGLSALAEAAEARGSFVEALAARRALLDGLMRDEEPDSARVADQRGRVRALEVLIGGAERVRGRAGCHDEAGSLVRRALARCP